ncbi:KAT8 regulatory NSL complex subunit 1-like isoform X1 [Myxocyprinus asiaticus]|uniref:KAT8 regulatory NSL complex subunit 1-like isoform X1 n=1 Tax=Myxocyprinus asiaticus TaxID=70543 RepID=UPI002223A68B|nr:KAT8 regulatory NSL complex subunit 1-like isoform X1 [Myxocyprinus asiaticus]
MYYYCNWNKMSASAAGPGVESCGAGCPHSASRCCGGGGCGEPVSGDGSSAAAATATSAAPAQSPSVAEAQAFCEWDDDTKTSIDEYRAQKMNKEGFFANGTVDITRDRDECADSGKYGRGRFCRQSTGAGEDNRIKIDLEVGDRRCVMSALTRRDERRATARLQPLRTGRTLRGQTARTETEGSMITAAARCGHGNPEPAVIKRRGCSFTRASKKVCFSGISSVTYCGRSDAVGRGRSNGEAQVKGSVGSTETFKSGRQVDTPKNRRVQSENTKVRKINFAEGGNGMENTELPTCRTAKGRVRMYRVRSFLASSANHNNGVSGNGAPHVGINNSSSSQPSLPLSDQAPDPERDQEQPPQQSRLHGRVKKPLCALAINSSHTESTQSGSGPLNGTEHGEGSPIIQNNNPARCDSTGEGPSELEGPSNEQMDTVRGEAELRQVELEGRTDYLWRRLQAVQVKQVERHVSQQLRGLYRSPGLSCTRRPGVLSRNSAELSRLARSCSEILRTAETALDSDHTASSSGGDSDSEEDEGLEGGRRLRPLPTKYIVTGKEWQWLENRAWLGSRWVWLQTHVSELEYRIRALTELYTHLRQEKVRTAYSVLDTPLRTSNPSPISHNCKLSSVGDPNRKWQTEETPTPQTVPSPPSSAARVRPLLWQRRHRLIRLEDCAALGSKAVSLQCWCEPPTLCVLCGGAPPRSTSDKEKDLWTRQGWLDMSVHPVLSMPSDSPLALHCGIRPLVRHHSHNSIQWMDMSTASSWLGRRGQGRAGRVRRRLVCPRPPNTLPPLFNTPGGSGYRSQRGVISPICLPHRATDWPTLLATPPATDTPAQTLRRRRAESSFDIDNLVMPLGLAGLGARVQKLQYKEIITPSWRELDSLSGVSKNQEQQHAQLLNYINMHHQPNGEELENEEEVEDLCDAVFLSRHAVCESRERSRWGSWARRRRRGRSFSSYHGDGKSSSRLEQTPGSPDSRQSHCAEGDVSPCSPFCTTAEDPFSMAEEEQQAVLPWERRSFPLQESELQWLQEEEEEEPNEDPCTASGRSQSTDSGISVGSLELSPRTPQPCQQHSGSERATPNTLFCKPAIPTTNSTAQDSTTLPLSLYSPLS